MLRYVIYSLLLLTSLSAHAQIRVDTSYTAESLVQQVFVGEISEVKTVRYRGSYQALGLFETEKTEFPLSRGIILSSGQAKAAIGPNQNQSQSKAFHTNGDEHLDKLSARTTYDAAVLEFTFLPRHNTIAFEYIFASEEYPEYVNKGFNDVFAFILTDLSTRKEKNLALVPATNLPVHIDNINAKRNAEWFIDNTNRKASPFYDVLEYDGMTQLLSAQASVVPGRYYRIKLAIADVDDAMLDSSVILKEKSFRSFEQPEEEAEEIAAIAPSIVLFDWDSSTLSDQAKAQLQNFAAQVLAHSPSAIRVIGHTDDWGASEYNEKLARRRVQAVVNYLAALGLKGKVDLYRQSKGENEPVASNVEAAGRSQNRRVEVRVER